MIDPYLPNSGNFGYHVSHYDLDLEYKVAINRLSGSATITAVTLTQLRTFTLDLSDALTVAKVTVNGRRPAHFGCYGGKLHVGLDVGAAGRGRAVRRRALRRLAAAGPITLGRGRFRGAVRRRSGRRPTQRRRVVVSLRRPSQRQGQLPHPGQHRKPVRGDRQRCPGVAAGAGRADRVDLRTTRADVDLPGHPADRHVRDVPTGRGAGADAGRAAFDGCGATSTTTSGGSRR